MRRTLINTMQREVTEGRAALWVDLNRKGQIDNDTLYDLYSILQANIDPNVPGDKSDAQLMRELLDIAEASLRTSDVFEGVFPDGRSVLFTTGQTQA